MTIRKFNVNKRNTLQRNKFGGTFPVNPTLHYNGGCDADEDFADYIPHGFPLKGTVIA